MSQATIERPRVIAAAAVKGNSSLPPFPTIQSINDQIPIQSLPAVVSTSATRLAIWANSDESSTTAYTGDIAGADGAAPGQTAYLETYWDGQPAANYTLTMRQYWLQVPGTYTLIQPGGSFTKSFDLSHGISDTDSETISAELGVSVDGLSASVTATFSHSVTTSTEASVTTTYTAGPPLDGYQRVWVLWQLIDELVALDPNGNVISNPNPLRKGNVAWNGKGRKSNGAFLSYTTLQQAFPSQTFMPQQQDFKNPTS